MREHEFIAEENDSQKMLGTETPASSCAFQADMLSLFSLDIHAPHVQLVCTEKCSILRFVLCILLRGLASQDALRNLSDDYLNV